MAYAQQDIARFNQSGLKARFQQLRDTFEQRAARRAVFHRTVDELQALSDRELADLGFHRSEIPRIARQAVAEA
ncbi:DUF1127 domain-containing protein [Salipiger mucosus]|uniref:YjiS-like domain-containing protein n=1 Tax=Salipiger mucosus DSM 16094 TaxID=1123237 RepID=S9RNE1_9RHOB|nr:DUF1127 domain-containing protein [Salipiger mucosus]EPX75499.1 hypothetical protein Salmuc_04018 [Salipiger mucosus DSM 16094]